jgi:hypothetical protein
MTSRRLGDPSDINYRAVKGCACRSAQLQVRLKAPIGQMQIRSDPGSSACAHMCPATDMTVDLTHSMHAKLSSACRPSQGSATFATRRSGVSSTIKYRALTRCDTQNRGESARCHSNSITPCAPGSSDGQTRRYPPRVQAWVGHVHCMLAESLRQGRKVRLRRSLGRGHFVSPLRPLASPTQVGEC